MAISKSVTANKLAHYRAWVDAWLTVKPSELPAEQCLAVITSQGPQWLQMLDCTVPESVDFLHAIVSCFKTAAKARLIVLGGKVPPSSDEWNVLSESYDARVKCACSGLYPVTRTLDATELKSCGCKAIERMIVEGGLVSNNEDEWNSSTFFSSQGLSSAMTELALCHSDIQPTPSSCRGEQGNLDWPEVRAPDRKPHPERDLDEKTYHSLYPTHERIRLSSDAKYFFAVASGASLVDPGIQMAIADSGNDILIGDYCDAATEECLMALQKIGAAAFAFLKVCVFAGLVTDWQFDHLVAQVIQFRIISYWRDHAASRRPHGIYGSRMTAVDAHRHIDLGMAVGIISASLATGQTMTAEEYKDFCYTSTLINDLVDFRGDTWRNQRENVVLRGVRGCLCTYLDSKLSDCIEGAATAIGRGKTFALMVLCFCNWMLLSSGHKLYEIVHGVRLIETNPPCCYASEANGGYERLLASLEPYGTLGDNGPHITMTRKELQMLYAKHKLSSDDHVKWMADVVRIVLHPGNLRVLVDVVHYQWTGELGSVDYCA